MPRHRLFTALTEDQKRIASDPANIKIALKLANRYKRRFYWMFDEILSAAMYGLVYASRYDPVTTLTPEAYIAWAVRSYICNAILNYDRGWVRRELGIRVGYIEAIIGPDDKDKDIDTPVFLADNSEPPDYPETAVDEVRSIIRKLPTNLRQVMTLHYLYGYSWGEIAVRCDSTAKAVRQLHYRAISYLRANYSRETLSVV